MFDYLVVGLGLAGISFCEQLERNGKSFKVISDDSQTSSEVAAGLYNPVILKRFTLAWRAKEQLDLVRPFYGLIEEKLGVQLDHKVAVLRRFASVSEQNDWFGASAKKDLGCFLSKEILTNQNGAIDAPYGYGQVLHTGRIDTRKLVSAYGDYLQKSDKILRHTFVYADLKILEDHIEYRTHKAKQIVFAEGFGLSQNPFFNDLPLNGTKGELLTIKAPQLQEQRVVKGPVFMIPMYDEQYLVGATYEWKDKTNTPTEKARAQLLRKLDTFLKCAYEVVGHSAGIRPTVSDRRPLVGRHSVYKNLYVLNGMGSRGVMTAPYAARKLFEFIEYENPIDETMNISRFQIT